MAVLSPLFLVVRSSLLVRGSLLERVVNKRCRSATGQLQRPWVLFFDAGISELFLEQRDALIELKYGANELLQLPWTLSPVLVESQIATWSHGLFLQRCKANLYPAAGPNVPAIKIDGVGVANLAHSSQVTERRIYRSRSRRCGHVQRHHTDVRSQRVSWTVATNVSKVTFTASRTCTTRRPRKI